MNPRTDRPIGRTRVAHAAVGPLIALILGYIGVMGPTLGAEYFALRGDWRNDVKRRVIGFPGITPTFSHAHSPQKWVYDDGDKTLLWAGWDRKATKHTWFVLGKGEVTAEHLSHAMGRDVARAIDTPKLESGKGEVWDAMKPDTPVVVGEFRGVAVAYPLGVLDKVLIVNDEIHKQPCLVVHTPFVADEHAGEMFNPLLEGKRVMMGYAGYLWDGRPLLYDRETQSLWIPNHRGLEAIAGKRKGAVLTRLAHLDPMSWGEWSAAHPDGRLVAGAIRSDSQNP